MLDYPDFTDRGEAPCVSSDPEAFFPEPDAPGAAELARQAIKVCGDCTYQLECLAYALENHEDWGIWGGKTPFERRKLLRARAGGVGSLRASTASTTTDYV